MGLLAILTGVLMAVRPPAAKLPLPLAIPFAVFFLLTLLVLLPVAWPFRPEWWSALKNDFGVDLTLAWSPQPWVTLEEWCRYLVCCSWLLWWVCRTPGYADIRIAMRTLAVGTGALAATALVFLFAGWEPAWWDFPDAPQFGPMANRNVFAALMSMGCIASLASAYDMQRRRKGSWIIFALMVLPMFASVIMNRSRAGIVLFLVAIILWFTTISMKHGMVQRMAIAGSMLLAATAVLMIFGKPLLDRFIDEHENIADMIREDGRVTIYSETLRLASMNPALGFGLGNFSDVFRLTNELHDPKDYFRHPESDWLWLVAETGFFATVLLGVAGVMLMLWSLPHKSGNDEARRGERRLHTAASIGAGMALLQSMVNPVLHALPFFLCFAVFVGMAIYPARWRKAKALPTGRLFQCLGAGSVLAGMVWIGSQTGATTWFGITAHRAGVERAFEKQAEGDAAGALSIMEDVVAATPLHWESYFERAAARLAAAQPSQLAAADFAVARYLEPNIHSITNREAEIWLQYEPSMAISAWRETLRRSDDRFKAGYYSTMLTTMRVHPELRGAIRSLAQSPQLMVQYLYSARDDAELKEALGELLLQHPSLEQLTNIERRRVFQLWYDKGDRQALLTQIRQTPVWAQEGWPILAQDAADKGDPRAACDLALKNLKPPVKLAGDSATTLTQLARDFSLQPNDPRRALELFHAQLNLGQTQDALKTLLRVKAMPGAPRYLDYEFARVYAKMGDYSKSWESMRHYMAANPEA